MNKNLPLKVAGLIFSIIAIMHFLRLIYHWQVLVGTHIIPMSVSAIGFLIAIILAIWMFIAAYR